jgi:hypothetical protein
MHNTDEFETFFSGFKSNRRGSPQYRAITSSNQAGFKFRRVASRKGAQKQLLHADAEQNARARW